MSSNFWMGRTSFFREHNVRWSERLDTSEEHEDFFMRFPGKLVVINDVSCEHYPTDMKYGRSGLLGLEIKYDYSNLYTPIQEEKTA